ncbi:hypothetical protein OIV83_002350 [Microbotryomycetes sp. JL201]|nr:hypothetical protein OIV83_002350 [Microbotryomycetes sp. JL201]
MKFPARGMTSRNGNSESLDPIHFGPAVVRLKTAGCALPARVQQGHTTPSAIAMNYTEPQPLPEHAKGVTVEEIVAGTRCSPLTLKEFEAFLIHEERSVENLQFTVWYRSYCQRFNALPPEYQALSDAPSERYAHTPAASIRTAGSVYDKDSWWKSIVRRGSSWSARSVRSVDLEKGEGTEKLTSANGATPRDDDKDGQESPAKDGDNISLRSAAAPDTPKFSESTAFPQAKRDNDTLSVNTADTRGTKRFGNSVKFPGLAPLKSIMSRKELPEGTPMPFVDEIKLIATTFFVPGSSKELNIDARLRRYVLKYIQPTNEDGTVGEPITTHPDVFKDVADHVYSLMERSLPHYLQWAKGNTNTPKRLFWTGVGIFDMGLGVMFACIIIYFARSRWWRIFSFFFFWFGSMQAYSAYFYFCSQVHGRTARQLYPWELSDSVSEVDKTEDFSQPSLSTTFVSAKNPNSEASTSKHMADLQASLPFLFDDPDPFKTNQSGPALIDNDKKKGPTTTTGTSKGGKSAAAEPKSRFRSRFWASMRDRNGRRMKVFGPEKVVADPYIQRIHNKQMREILIFGTVVTFLFLCIVVAIPEKTPLR